MTDLDKLTALREAATQLNDVQIIVGYEHDPGDRSTRLWNVRDVAVFDEHCSAEAAYVVALFDAAPDLIATARERDKAVCERDGLARLCAVRRLETKQARAKAQQYRDERDRLRGELEEASAVIFLAGQQVGLEHPAWVTLDDFDGSGDACREMERLGYTRSGTGGWHASKLATPGAEATPDEPAPSDETWRDYTIESQGWDAEPCIRCRGNRACSGELLTLEDRYLTLGEAVDWAKAHHAGPMHAAPAEDEPAPSDPAPCDTCGDTGWIQPEAQVGVPGSGSTHGCPDCDLGRARLARSETHDGDSPRQECGCVFVDVVDEFTCRRSFGHEGGHLDSFFEFGWDDPAPAASQPRVWRTGDPEPDYGTRVQFGGSIWTRVQTLAWVVETTIGSGAPGIAWRRLLELAAGELHEAAAPLHRLTSADFDELEKCQCGHMRIVHGGRDGLARCVLWACDCGAFRRRLPACATCGHRHRWDGDCADHPWRDTCHYNAGSDCVGEVAP